MAIAEPRSVGWGSVGLRCVITSLLRPVWLRENSSRNWLWSRFSLTTTEPGRSVLLQHCSISSCTSLAYLPLARHFHCSLITTFRRAKVISKYQGFRPPRGLLLPATAGHPRSLLHHHFPSWSLFLPCTLTPGRRLEPTAGVPSICISFHFESQMCIESVRRPESPRGIISKLILGFFAHLFLLGFSF